MRSTKSTKKTKSLPETVTVSATSSIGRQSARKVRLVADAVRGIETPAEALLRLSFVEKRAAAILKKTISQAVANAVSNFKLPEHLLVIRTIQVNQGPTMKRHRFGGRGGVKPILKRTSRVTVTLAGKKEGGVNGAKS